MRHLPLTLRALVLLPLLAVGADQTRAALLCGPRAESCLEAASSGWSTVGVLALVLYGVGARAARRTPRRRRAGLRAPVGARHRRRLGFLRRPGRARRRRRRGPLGGGWLGLLALGVLAGAVLALALRVAPAARALVRSRAPPRRGFSTFAAIASRPLQRSPMGASAARLRLTRGRAPPVAA